MNSPTSLVLTSALCLQALAFATPTALADSSPAKPATAAAPSATAEPPVAKPSRGRYSLRALKSEQV